MVTRSGAGERLEKLWRQCSRYPGGVRVFNLALSRMIPYSGTIGARVLELEPGRARVAMRDRHRVRNHLRSIHAIALVNLGELTTGLALNCGMPSSQRAILVGISMDYSKKARGTITAEARCPRPAHDQDGEIEVTSQLRDTVGDVVATARARWRVGPTPSR